MFFCKIRVIYSFELFSGKVEKPRRNIKKIDAFEFGKLWKIMQLQFCLQIVALQKYTNKKQLSVIVSLIELFIWYNLSTKTELKTYQIGHF